ncbi:solute carrier family 35 member B4 [Cricetulus griseus]
MRPAFAVGLVFAGCCSNVIFLELLARKHPGCGNIVTFAQFLFIAVEGFLFEADLGRKPPAIPLRYYAIMVTMFFTVSVMNNYALNLNIAMPLHMIFRSGSLIANMILGIIILKKRYSMFKYTSIALVSAGIFICTFMSAKQVTSQSSLNEKDGFQAFARWLLGKYVCIRGVFILTTECTSLTVTLVVTLRKFVSLIFSILYFQNPFTLWHCLGTLFVFIGTLMYTEVWKNLGTTKSQLQKADKKD